MELLYVLNANSQSTIMGLLFILTLLINFKLSNLDNFLDLMAVSLVNLPVELQEY